MENLIKASAVLYDKEICDTMNKLKLEEKIIMENKVPEVIFKNTDEYYKKKEESFKILKKGVESNITKFVEPFNNHWHIRDMASIDMYQCFYDSLYDCLFNMFNNKIYCQYQASKILNEIDRTFEVLYNNESFDISKKSKEESIELVYDLIEAYLQGPNSNYEEYDLFNIENIYFICNKCNKKTTWMNLNSEPAFIHENICEICQPSNY